MTTVTKPELLLDDSSQNKTNMEAISDLPRILTLEQAEHLLQRLAEPPRPLTPAMQRAILTYQRYMFMQKRTE